MCTQLQHWARGCYLNCRSMQPKTGVLEKRENVPIQKEKMYVSGFTNAQPVVARVTI